MTVFIGQERKNHDSYECYFKWSAVKAENLS